MRFSYRSRPNIARCARYFSRVEVKIELAGAARGRFRLLGRADHALSRPFLPVCPRRDCSRRPSRIGRGERRLGIFTHRLYTLVPSVTDGGRLGESGLLAPSPRSSEQEGGQLATADETPLPLPVAAARGRGDRHPRSYQAAYCACGSPFGISTPPCLHYAL